MGALRKIAKQVSEDAIKELRKKIMLELAKDLKNGNIVKLLE